MPTYNRCEVISRISDRINQCVPLDSLPEQVKEIYNTAVDLYGEKNVDLQNTFIPLIWESAIADISSGKALKLLGIYNKIEISKIEETSLPIYKVFSSPEKLEPVLAAINTEELLLTDLPLYSILIHFHDITVTNEFDHTTKIEDIYACVPITPKGTIMKRMLWCRTTTSRSHWSAGYIHSHASNDIGDIFEWVPPCLGYGPICNTMSTLSESFCKDFWSLFWLELDKCIKTESLTGGPFKKLEQLNSILNFTECYRSFDFTCIYLRYHKYKDLINEIVLRLINDVDLKYRYHLDHIEPAVTFVDFTLLVSKMLLEYLDTVTPETRLNYRKLLEDSVDLLSVQLSSDRNVFFGYMLGDKFIIDETIDKKPTFSFKGEPVEFKIVEDLGIDYQKDLLTIVHPRMSAAILHRLTLVINNVYARKEC